MTITERAARYVETMDEAVSGSGGHNATFAVAVALIHGFDLSEDEAWPILLDYNKRCEPPWTEKELRHKLASADNLKRHPQPRGYLRGTPAAKPAKAAIPLRLRFTPWREMLANVTGKEVPLATPQLAAGADVIQTALRLFNGAILPELDDPEGACDASPCNQENATIRRILR